MKKKSKILLVALIGILTLGAIGFGTYSYFNEVNNQVVENEDNGISTTIKSEGVKVKLLSTRTTASNEIVKTFSYEVKPENATNQKVTASAIYLDNTDCSDVVTVSVDQSTKTITVTCKGAFEELIIVTIKSVDNPNAKAEITLNYLQRLVEMTTDVTNLFVGNGWEGVETTSKVTYTDLFKPVYSLYTKEVELTYGLKDLEVNFDESTYDSRGLSSAGWTSLYQNLESLVYESFENQTALPDKDDLWNLVDSNEYRAWLLEQSVIERELEDNYLCVEVRGTLYNIQDPSIEVQIGGGSYFYVYISLQNDYTSYKVGVDSITVETSEVDF